MSSTAVLQPAFQPGDLVRKMDDTHDNFEFYGIVLERVITINHIYSSSDFFRILKHSGEKIICLACNLEKVS